MIPRRPHIAAIFHESKPRKTMKTRAIITLFAIACIAYSVTSCVTVETKTIAPDGTVTTTKTTAPDAASVALATEVVKTSGKINREVHPDK